MRAVIARASASQRSLPPVESAHAKWCGIRDAIAAPTAALAVAPRKDLRDTRKDGSLMLAFLRKIPPTDTEV